MINTLDDLYEARAALSEIAADARSARWAAGNVLIGGAGLHREGVAARWGTYVPPSATTIVGRFLGFETAGDVEVSLDKLDTDMAVFNAELTGQVSPLVRELSAARAALARWKASDGLTAYGPLRQRAEDAQRALDAHGAVTAQPDAFVLHVWMSFFDRWNAFYAKSRTWFANFMRDHRHERDGYLEQLQQMRAQAAGLGIAVTSPDPTVPAASPLDQLLSFAKVLLYGSLLVGGVWALAMLWRAYRG
jgi:hypothetical protein